MKIDCLTPQGSKITQIELADWKKNACNSPYFLMIIKKTLFST